ncbi:SDR family oxidoreductase [Halococcus saccharolyticus]|uniref:D-beta-hydroxybutyrate dehydrogenase n=1 Tax=Halococcus saccharolyticus DSM 5350 TaxID=1227455 RepID=M0MDA9_9EURY|nr:SDR family oxidoreductase [Halococcus saccharolyticus]EMA43757.1 D-beta-hydroxybutyrate dehydrogenase [Halococcus saccharolyticus DSM 5350]
MSTDDFEIDEPELTTDDLLVLEDPRFTADTVAIVTGAASGIGEATALALAANGLTTVGLDIDEEGLDATADLADDLGVPGEFVPAPTDLTDDEAVERAVDEAAEHGDLRYVANIAGLQHIAAIENFPMERYDFMQSVMVRAPFLLAKHAIPHIEATDDGVGAIANMSSVHGHYATQDKAAYITAKHALHGMMRSIAAEGEGSLRGFSVSVGYVLTPLMVNQIEDTAAERGIDERRVVEDVMLGQARTKEMMTPAEVANLFVFGFSRHAKHLNGGDLLFDGGYTHTYE